MHFVWQNELTRIEIFSVREDNIIHRCRGEKTQLPVDFDRDCWATVAQVEIMCVAVLSTMIENAALVPKLIERHVTPAITQVCGNETRGFRSAAESIQQPSCCRCTKLDSEVLFERIKLFSREADSIWS